MTARPLFALLLLAACGGSDTLTQPEPPPIPPEPGADAVAVAEPAAAADAGDAHEGEGSKDAAHAHPEPGSGGAFAAAPDGASVAFGAPADGATVTSPVALTFKVEGMTVQPAGTLTEGTGHHHVIVDSEGIPAGEAVPADETHIHFGKGQTETSLELTPGPHTLTLQFADGAHRSYGPKMSTKISVVVEAPAE